MTIRLRFQTLAAKVHRNKGRMIVGLIAVNLVIWGIPKLGMPIAVEDTISGLLGWLAMAILVLLILVGFYYPQPTPQSLVASKTGGAKEFWAEVARRKRHLNLITLGWLVVGFPLWKMWDYLLQPADPMVSGTAALATWASVAFWFQWRLWSLKCFNCGKRAIGGTFHFRITNARCQHCGTPHVSA